MIVRTVSLIAWLTVVWVALWGDFTPANVVGGLAVAGIVIIIFPGTRGEPRRSSVSPMWTVVFVLFFHWKLLQANLVLAREILTPRDHSRSGTIAVPIEGVSDLVVTVIANAITLTPGTISLEVHRDPARLYLHVLHLYDPERVRRDVLRLLELAVRAIGRDPARARTRPGIESEEG